MLNNRETLGPPVAVDVYGVQGKSPHNPGWFNYGIHSIEMLFTLLGAGHKAMTYTAAGHAEHSSGPWQNGANNTLGSVTLTAKGDYPFGFTYIGEKATKAARVNADVIYRELVKQIVQFFQSGKAPIQPGETLAIVQYIEDVNNAGAV